jgi:hypothetical protein
MFTMLTAVVHLRAKQFSTVEQSAAGYQTAEVRPACVVGMQLVHELIATPLQPLR